MTHTAEPMTLDGVLEGIESLIRQCARTSIYEPIQEAHCKKLADEFERWTSVIKAELAKQREAEPVAWRPMNTAPRDGTVIVLRFGEDGESPGWFDSPAHPIKNDDGTWPDNPYGHPWAFIDKGSEIKHGEDVGAWFVNHARDTEYGPTHWRPYTHPQQRNAVEDECTCSAKDMPFGQCCKTSAVASRDREDADAVATDDLVKLLPGPYYMDQPDGGNVSLHDQLKRMSEDAARYRFLRSQVSAHSGKPFICIFHGSFGLWNDEFADTEIDAARRENKP
jgi:hypothetical protein